MELASWITKGQIKVEETVKHGFENTPQVKFNFLMLKTTF